MYGQMTAGSWIYIGTQGILQGTYETFAAVAATQRFGGTLAGTLTLTGGCGGMGGAQPLAVTMNDGVSPWCVDVDPARLRAPRETATWTSETDGLDDALRARVLAGEGRATGTVGRAGGQLRGPSCPSCSAADVPRSTSSPTRRARTTRSRTCPRGVDVGDWHDYAVAKPAEFTERARLDGPKHVEAMVGFLDAGAEVFDYGNSIRGEARSWAAFDRAFAFPGFVPGLHPPAVLRGQGPVPLGRACRGTLPTSRPPTARCCELFPDDDRLATLARARPERVAFQGLPARICWLGYGERDKAGLRFNELVAAGEVSAPIVIGRDHLDCGSVASPYRETESMLDGSDAIADWPLLNALVNTASGASWVSIHHGGGVGIGRSIHAGQVSVADGTALAAQKLERVLTNDPGMGIIRHVDAGYDEATEVAGRTGVRIPMREQDA